MQTADRVPTRQPGHGDVLSHYEFGATALFASRTDPRFSYCLYVPSSYEERGERRYPLAVLVHGTTRTAQKYRDLFTQFAEANDCMILAPLFPAGITAPYELGSYKFLREGGVAYDLVLLDIVDEVADRYRIDRERFLMHGFSGGGHFAHRFYYVHPERLMGVSIGAPGLITLLDPSRPWWIGTADLAERFGAGIDLDALRSVPVHMVIGADDTDTWEINNRDSPRWIEGADEAGATRIDRLQALRRNYEERGIAVRFDVVADVGHHGFRLLEPVESFFADVLRQPAWQP